MNESGKTNFFKQTKLSFFSMYPYAKSIESELHVVWNSEISDLRENFQNQWPATALFTSCHGTRSKYWCFKWSWSVGKAWGPWIYQFPPSIKYNFPSKAKALLREAPKGFDTLEVEHLSAPVPVKELHFLGRGWRATCDVFGRYEDWFPTRFLIGLFATRKVEHPSGRMINLTTSSKKDHWISCRVMSRERR